MEKDTKSDDIVFRRHVSALPLNILQKIQLMVYNHPIAVLINDELERHTKKRLYTSVINKIPLNLYKDRRFGEIYRHLSDKNHKKTEILLIWNHWFATIRSKKEAAKVSHTMFINHKLQKNV